MKRNEHGFTLIELLTVIAIIAILAAILLPVLGRAREQGRRAACQSNLHQIAMAIKMYKNDNRGFPFDWTETGAAPAPRIVIAGDHWFGPADAQGKPTGERAGYGLATLYPDYVTSLKIFNCPNNDVTDTTPPNPPGANDPTEWAQTPNYRAYNSYDGMDPIFEAMGGPATAFGSALKYDRTPWDTQAAAGSRSQFKRMLYWRNPSEDTVITWCSQHRSDSANASPRAGDMDVIVFLDGSNRPVKSDPGTGEPGHQSSVAGGG